ncbi:globin domain-containing protein [Saccharopolyspora gloriosae]|uniref:globin domain-containing protein n=1 Tax=Saccharopolyspora gloriosae TaxID=455344 RepID=UPI001FB61A0B|nr:globin domain-containing protein [Saccharopolyspora gloriosae]
MLSAKSAETIRATLPAVGGAIAEISSVFYDKLFAAHPELLRDLFNRGNQANGTQQQALAGAIAAFATALVENPDTPPETMLNRIAHKHASLGIARDQYYVVHTHLFAAISEVLGEAVTDDVAAAWSEVYWLLADSLSSIEDRLYAESDHPGTWRDYRVVGRYAETDDAITLLARPADGLPVPSRLPGQYVSVQVELPDGARQIRQYSLTGTRTDAVEFTVKNARGTPDGEVSGHLHRHVTEGDLLQLSAPFGDVTLDEGDGPVLLASAGIGCTPMIGMLGHLASTDSPRQVVAVHADRSERTHARRAEFDQLVTKLPNATGHVWYEAPEAEHPGDRTGLVDLSTLNIPEGTTAYLCGPLPFLRALRAQLLDRGVPADDIRYEVFGPDMWLAR